MFTSVIERTRQIGILKSLGATDGEIMKIFLTEAGLIGLIGGVLGALSGLITSGLLSELGIRLLSQGSFEPVVTPELVIFAVVL